MNGNISVFIPHEGCKHRCSFCNQKAITGRVTKDDVKNIVEKANNPKAEIAFFGGSFTLIDRDYMINLLDTAKMYVDMGKASAIRFSTRPDGISKEILDIIKKYPVKTIELGAQSMCDDVLKANLRGHSKDCVIKASKLIKEYGFNLGLQMMLGLYKSDDEKDILTAKEIIALKPDCVRIYPTVVIKNTLLEKLYLNKEYTPLELEHAVELSAKILEMFLDNNIPVIRLGLHEVSDNIAGPFHPAFGELAQSRLMLNKAKRLLKTKGDYKIFVGKSFVSKMIGQHRINLAFLKEMGYNCSVFVEKIEDYNLRVEKTSFKECK